jgi:hypothetical protein
MIFYVNLLNPKHEKEITMDNLDKDGILTSYKTAAKQMLLLKATGAAAMDAATALANSKDLTEGDIHDLMDTVWFEGATHACGIMIAQVIEAVRTTNSSVDPKQPLSIDKVKKIYEDRITNREQIIDRISNVVIASIMNAVRAESELKIVTGVTISIVRAIEEYNETIESPIVLGSVNDLAYILEDIIFRVSKQGFKVTKEGNFVLSVSGWAK